MVRLELRVLMLVLLEASPGSRAGSSTGLEFLVVFPENVAYYYPGERRSTLYFTSLRGNTTVALSMEGVRVHTWNMQAGDVDRYQIRSGLELAKSTLTNKVVHISSNNPITVESVSVTQSVTQSALVLSSDQLGSSYIIPSFGRLTHVKHPLHISSTAERSPHRVIVVNTDQDNQVTLEGLGTTRNLSAHQALQIYLNAEDDLRAVRARRPVAVLVSHTCARRRACSCGLLYTVLSPETNQHQTFVVPSELAGTSGNESVVFLYNSESTTAETYDPNSPVLSVAGAAVLYQPDFNLLPLIPERSFASCYALRGFPDTENAAVIVVHKDRTDGVRLGKSSLESEDWQPVSGTEYVSLKISLAEGKNVLWHVSSTMGVYHMGKFQNVQFGNPAPVLSRTPDPRGCIVTPEGFEIGPVPGGWRESVSYCRGKNLELVGFPDAELKQHVHRRIAEEKENDLKRVWIGMRLGLRSGAWYWLDKKPLTEMDWSDGEPDLIHDRQCVAMSVDEGFGWTTEHCCVEVKPVCYKEPVLFPL